MHTETEIATEIAKLNQSQRKALRCIVSTPLDRLAVETRGHKTMVHCHSIGHRHIIKIGPRGMILYRWVTEA